MAGVKRNQSTVSLSTMNFLKFDLRKANLLLLLSFLIEQLRPIPNPLVEEIYVEVRTRYQSVSTLLLPGPACRVWRKYNSIQ